MKAILLAAGFGTRLRPVTNVMPKPMVPVANRPLIGWAVEALVRAGIDDIVINLHYLPEAIERYVTGAFDVRFHFSLEQPEILGSGGGIRKARAWLDDGHDFFAANADTLQFPRWHDLARARRAHDALAALSLRHPPEGDRYTSVWLEDDAINGFGDGHGEPLLFGGAQCLSARVFRYFPDCDVSGIVDDVFKPLIAERRETLAGVVDDNPLWFDIGTPRRYVGASRGMLDGTLRGDVAVVDGSRIDGDCIVHESARGRAAHSVIGARSVIEGTVRDSSVWNDCVIGANVTLDGCVVAHGVELVEGDFRNQLICRDETGQLATVEI